MSFFCKKDYLIFFAKKYTKSSINTYLCCLKKLIKMKRLTIILFSILMISAIPVLAKKKPIIVFNSTAYDFGIIMQNDGAKTCKFDFINKGKDTLKITGVSIPGIGLIANWTKTPIPPKGIGFVEITLNPKTILGPIQTSIEVNSNDPALPKVKLLIQAVVEKPVAEEYPSVLGHLRFGTSQITYTNLPSTAIQLDTMKIYNEWNQVMTFEFTKLPAYITCKVVPEKLNPSQKGLLLVTYDAAARNEFGMVYDRFTFETNDSLQPEKQVSISANIIEDFSKMTPEELANAAKIKFENTTFDFGTVREGDKVETEFVFTNTGKNDLYIRKVKGS